MQVISGNQVVESTTGEVIQENGEVKDLILENRSDPIAELIAKTGSVPVHVAKAKELSVLPPVLSSYVGYPPSSPGDFLGQLINLTGAIVYFSGRFSPKVTDPNAPGYKTGEGFYTFLMKTDRILETEFRVGREIMTFKRNLILKCDGVKIRETVIWLIDQNGWFDWNVKVPVVFTRGADQPYFMQIIPDEAVEAFLNKAK